LQISSFDADKIDQSPDCISAYGEDLKILIWNKACEKKYGIPKEEALSKNLLHFFPHIEDDYRVTCFRRCYYEQQTFFFPNLPLLYSAGLYSQVILPLHNGKKEVVGTLNIVREGEYHPIKKEDLIYPLHKKEHAHSRLLPHHR
jgi:PAS domain-containing protein